MDDYINEKSTFCMNDYRIQYKKSLIIGRAWCEGGLISGSGTYN